MGTSVGYHLAAAGVPDVVLLETRTLASGSSGKPLGGVRSQFSHRANIELGARSLAAFRGFRDTFGVDIGFQQVGYLFLFRDPVDAEQQAAGIELQNALGARSRLISGAEASRLTPYVDPAVVVAATWSPGDGFARPTAVVNGYAEAAVAAGATVIEGCPVAGVDRVGDGRVAIRCRDGRAFVTPTLICTAGAWSRQVGAMVDVDLPVEPLRRQVAFTGRMDPAPGRIPFTIDYSTTAYFHRDGDGASLLMGMAEDSQPVGFDTSVTTGWHAGLRRALAAFAPSLRNQPLGRGWAGLYEMTPDCNALIGEAETDGFRFLYATGFSGHGFLQGPAVGEAVRDIYLGRAPAVDISGFDARRFERGAERAELNII